MQNKNKCCQSNGQYICRTSYQPLSNEEAHNCRYTSGIFVAICRAGMIIVEASYYVCQHIFDCYFTF